MGWSSRPGVPFSRVSGQCCTNRDGHCCVDMVDTPATLPAPPLAIQDLPTHVRVKVPPAV